MVEHKLPRIETIGKKLCTLQRPFIQPVDLAEKSDALSSYFS